MNLKPIGDRVIVEVIEEEETTASGLVLASSALNSGAITRATVLAVGPGRWDGGQRVPLPVEVGNEVYISRYGGVEVEVEGESYLLVRETDILAVAGA